jgi:hypothetical protein
VRATGRRGLIGGPGADRFERGPPGPPGRGSPGTRPPGRGRAGEAQRRVRVGWLAWLVPGHSGTGVAAVRDDEIVAELRRVGRRSSPRRVADRLAELMEGGLTPGTLIAYFQRAFPEVPPRVLLDASRWHRLRRGRVSDERFEHLLGEWLPLEREG